MTDHSNLLGGTPPQLIRIQTLLQLRWIALAGQAAMILVCQYIYGLQVNALSYLAIASGVLCNLAFIGMYHPSKRLTTGGVGFMIFFDVAQYGALLATTGGIENPFAMILLAPLMISAFLLPAAGTVLIGASTIAMAIMLGRWSIPLRDTQGQAVDLSDYFGFSFATALIVSMLFLGFCARRITSEIQGMSDALWATQMALAREQKLTDLGGVIAATAHDLGTPLATIKLVCSELIEEIGEDKSEFLDDLILIRDQTNRCRDILLSMGRAGKDDRHLRQAPLETVIAEAASPHTNRGKEVVFTSAPLAGAAMQQPEVFRKPEIIHGLRNLIQNAVDFAREEVRVEMRWDQNHIYTRIVDDGVGFPSQTLGRLGEPFIGRRRLRFRPSTEPTSEGLGLGLFIAKTLLERSGATLHFANRVGSLRKPQSGAIVDVRWWRSDIEASRFSEGLGENMPNSF